MSPQPLNEETTAGGREVKTASRNAIKLGSSLLGTLGVAFAVRFWMPRFLGPEAFGNLHFAEQFAATFFAIGNLGVDTYIRKEVATRPRLASDFFGGLTLIRFFVNLILFGAMGLSLYGMGKSELAWQLAYLFGAGQTFYVLNTSLGSLLQANTTVNELSLINVASKIVWGAAVVGALLGGQGILAVGAVFCFVEVVKTPFLWALCRKHVDLKFRLDRTASWLMITASVPYFLNFLAYTIYAKIDVTMISALANDREVGWYGAAGNINLMIYLLMPILNAVVVPMGARLAAHSNDALRSAMGSAMRLVFMLTMVPGLLIALNAETIITVLFKADFAPGARSLQMIAPLVPIIYVLALGSSHLISLDRVWTVTKISLLGLVVNPVLNYFAIPAFHQRLGDGGAGMGAGASTLITEAVITVLLLGALRNEVINRAFVSTFVRVSITCIVVTAAHFIMPLDGIVLAMADAIIYSFVAIALGALPAREALVQAKQIIDRRRKR